MKTSENAIKAVIVMDACIATEANLPMTSKKGYDYLCITRSAMMDYILKGDKDDILAVMDNRKQKVTFKEDHPSWGRYYKQRLSGYRALPPLSPGSVMYGFLIISALVTGFSFLIFAIMASLLFDITVLNARDVSIARRNSLIFQLF